MYSELSDECKGRAFDYIARLHQLEAVRSGDPERVRVSSTVGTLVAPRSSPATVGMSSAAGSGAPLEVKLALTGEQVRTPSQRCTSDGIHSPYALLPSLAAADDCEPSGLALTAPARARPGSLG